MFSEPMTIKIPKVPFLTIFGFIVILTFDPLISMSNQLISKVSVSPESRENLGRSRFRLRLKIKSLHPVSDCKVSFTTRRKHTQKPRNKTQTYDKHMLFMKKTC